MKKLNANKITTLTERASGKQTGLNKFDKNFLAEFARIAHSVYTGERIREMEKKEHVFLYLNAANRAIKNTSRAILPV